MNECKIYVAASRILIATLLKIYITVNFKKKSNESKRNINEVTIIKIEYREVKII